MVSIDIELSDVDINQCDAEASMQAKGSDGSEESDKTGSTDEVKLLEFLGTHRCKKSTQVRTLVADDFVSAVQCSAVQCSAVQCDAVRVRCGCGAVRCGAVRCGPVHCVVLYCIVQCSAVQCSVVHYIALQCIVSYGMVLYRIVSYGIELN